MVGFQIFPYRLHRADIQIRTHHSLSAEHQSQDSQNPASRTHIKKYGIRSHIFFQLPDAELGGFMHSRPEGCSRIDMKDHFPLILLLYRFPGRDHEQIVNIKLVKVLFPVINPVNILRLLHLDASFADITERTKFFQLLPYTRHYRLFVRILSVYLQPAVLCFLHKKTEPGDAVILRPVRKDIHEHLLLLRRCERHLVLYLRPLQANIIKGAYNNIFRFGHRLDLKFFPLHFIIRSLQRFPVFRGFSCPCKGLANYIPVNYLIIKNL